jgi:ferredoxin-type protein NapH
VNNREQMKQAANRFRRWTWARRATAAIFLGLLYLGTRSDFPWVKGSTAGSTIFGVVPFVDPLAALEVTLASGSWMSTMMIGAVLLILLTATMGPVFCGWLCPLGLLLDLAQEVRRILGHALPRSIRKGKSLPHGIKYGVLVGALVFSAVSHLPVFQALSPIHLLTRVVLYGAEAGLWFIALLLFAEFFLPRVWCRSLCPLGALYSLLGRTGRFRVRINPAEVGKLRCRYCEIKCPMGIPIMHEYTLVGRKGVDHPDCTRCGACTDTCPGGTLYLGFREHPGE